MHVSRWVAVVPVKDPKRAKSRLGPELEPWRAELAAAFAEDTILALLAAERIDTVIVVGGHGLSASLLDHERVRTLPDPGDLNAAARHGIDNARHGHPEAGILVLTADLPAATPAALDSLLAMVPTRAAHVLPDVESWGSTGLLLPPGTDVSPAFGGASLARHLAAGAVAVELPGIEGLRRDVDTAEQLAQATALGVGPRTQAVLTEMANQGT